MIACYCWVSTRSLTVRKPRSCGGSGAMRCRSRVQWFEDIETGATLHRPAFAEMQRTIFPRTVFRYLAHVRT
jgi:hypothetical protein